LSDWSTSGTASLLSTATVHKNGVVNQLTGGDGADLFFAAPGDTLDLEAGEILIDL
jgi:hypothetical protein